MAANPYVEARREWDERYADLVLGKRNWQVAASGLLAATLILAIGMVWLATRSRYIPFVVEVDKLVIRLGEILERSPQLHQPLAIAVIGGFIFALPILLIVLPSFLRLIERRKERKRNVSASSANAVVQNSLAD